MRRNAREDRKEFKMVITKTFLFCLFVSQVGWLDASSSGEKADKDYELLVVTVATEETDGFKRFMRSTDKYDVNVKVVGMGVEWNGGDIQNWPGGGQKINLLKAALDEYKDDDNLIILFSDSYDVIFTTGAQEIIDKFLRMGANLLFSAESSIWPDPTLASQYPMPEEGYPFLCSGLYMGYAPYFWSALTYRDIEDRGDDQLFYTQLYLSPARDEWNIKLDHRASLFMNLNGARGDVKLMFEGANSMLSNVRYQTVPAVIHGNGPSKIFLNKLGNYLANYWTKAKGCLACGEGRIDLRSVQEKEYPTVLVALFLEQNGPFMDEYFKSIEDLEYPKDKIHLYIHVNVMLHYHDAKNFESKWENDYITTKVIIPAYEKTEAEARNEALNLMNELDCDYMFTVDSNVRLKNPEILKLLIEQNKPVIAPLVNIPDKLWSNFWGDVNAEGFYARSDDYVDILKGNRKGIWNVPFVSSIYLVMGKRVRPPNTPSFISQDGADADMTFCADLRQKGIFMYVMNIYEAGLILNMDAVETSYVHNDMWQMSFNAKAWEDKYIHPGYWEARKPDTEVEEVCPDVYQFPLMSETFADHLVDEMENFGQWSNGKNQDSRLEGGYENVPTRDIHMKQIGYERHWLYFLRTYVGPVCEKIFWGYSGRHYAVMNFVVRYRPDEQPFLRPHHDSSTYTINVALNTQGKDYEGGGARFTRYNCSCIGLQKGWTLMHPGKLTHQHEGLRTTNGTRYIMISFIDP